MIDFRQLLPNGKSFFTTISPDIDNLKEVLEYLIQHGADPNLPDKFNETSLHFVIIQSSYKYVDLLFKPNKINLSQQIFIFNQKFNESIC